MTRDDMAVNLSKEVGLRRREARIIIDRIFEDISGCLGRGENVTLRGFGTFSVRRQKARLGRNPRKPEIEVHIPERKVVHFKAGRKLSEMVK
ncbi:MAG: DNA-binding protein HU [Syntrophomonadaceae bacterium]|nr:DNA-binding protein HU [Bacillota bacterium]